MAHVLAIRSERVSLFRIGLFSNKPLLAAVSLTVTANYLSHGLSFGLRSRYHVGCRGSHLRRRRN